jgi:sugar phosphate isomerase/epimerase
VKLAISNIAWPIDHDVAVAEALNALGVSAIEIAPTKLWSAPLEATEEQIDICRRFWESRGMPIVAAQALLFGRPDLTLFQGAAIRRQTLDYLRGIIRVCAGLGAKALVFGSPKNRLAGGRDRAAVWQEAIDFFRELAECARNAGTTVVMEANPIEYGADFVTGASEALELVQAVHHFGFRLHLDTGCMTLAGDDPSVIIPRATGELAHFHVSEPNLAAIGSGPVDHPRFARVLAEIGYDGWISIEMRQAEPFDLQQLITSVEFARRSYNSP